MRHRSSARLAAALALGLLGACSDETVVRPEAGGVGGKFSGIVSGPEGPVAAHVWVESVARDQGIEDSWPETRLGGECGSDGVFEIDAPPGNYRVGVWISEAEDEFPWAGPGWSIDASVFWRAVHLAGNWYAADILPLEVGAVRDSLEFALGGLRFELDLPTEWIGGVLTLEVRRESPVPEVFDYYSRRIQRSIDAATTEITIPLLPPGVYRAELDVDYLDALTRTVQRARLWLPSGLVEEDATPIEVRAEELAVFEAAVIPERFTVRGEFDGVWRTIGVGPPYVWIVTADSTEVSRVQCDETGTFSELLWTHTPIKVGFGSSNELRWIGGRSFREATLFSPQVDREVIDVSFTDSALQVQLQGEGVIGSESVILELFDESGARVARGFSESPFGGDLVVPFLHPGRYRFRVTPGAFLATDWLAQWYDHADDFEHATPIEIGSAGELVSVEVSVEPGGRIQGTIHRGEARGSMVYLTRSDDSRILGFVQLRWSEEGFDLRGVPPGAYKVGAFPWWETVDDANELGPEARWYPNQLSWDDAGVITITGAETVSEIDFTLPVTVGR